MHWGCNRLKFDVDDADSEESHGAESEESHCVAECADVASEAEGRADSEESHCRGVERAEVPSELNEKVIVFNVSGNSLQACSG